MLNTRAIAVQGVGFSPDSLVRQGFWPDSTPATPVDEATVFLPRRRKRVKERKDTDNDVLLFLLK